VSNFFFPTENFVPEENPINSLAITENFIIEDLMYFPVGNYNPVLSRPYIVNATASAVDTIAGRLQEQKLTKITPNIIAGVANEIITPEATGFDAGLNRDWVSTRRFIFLLKVKNFTAIGEEINSYIMGFTDHDGISNMGNIDPNMNHFINNVIETVVMNITTPLGVIRKEKLYRIYNVHGSYNSAEMYSQRPKDILDNIDMLNIANDMYGPDEIRVYNIQNYINPFNQNTISSTVDNQITTEYLSKILTTGLLVNRSRDVHIDSYGIFEQNAIDSKVPEPSISDNRFLKFLSRIGGFKTTKDAFSFNQLMRIDNTIFNRFKLINLNKDIINPLLAATPEVGDHWYGRDIVTLKAYSLIENSVSLAVKYGFNKIFFTASNMANPTMLPEIFISDAKGFINLDEHDFFFLLEVFKEKFIQEVFLNETNSGTIPMHMECYVDLLGTTKINLSFANYPANWYTVPTFANSLFSPVLTTNKDAFDYTSFQISNVIDAISDKYNADKTYF